MQYIVTITGKEITVPTTVEMDIPSTRRDPFGWAAMKAVGMVREKANTIVYAKGEQVGSVREYGVYKGRIGTKPVSAKMTLRVERID